MQLLPTALPDVLLLEPRLFGDERGFFMETYNRAKFAELGIHSDFVQDNHSLSARGTVRGLHYQLDFAQAKLCRVIHGEVMDVALDIRIGSPTFGRAATAILSAENKRQIYVPRGFAHGFVVISETAEFLYKCDETYHPEDEHGITWDDPALGIEWGVGSPILSQRDTGWPRLAEIPVEYLPRYRS